MRKYALFLVFIVWQLLFVQTAFAAPLWSMEKPLTINSLSVSEDGEHAAIGTQDATAIVLGHDGSQKMTFTAKNVVTGVSLLRNGQLLVSSDDQHVYLLNADGTTVWARPFKKMVKTLTATPDGTVIGISVFRSNTVSLLDQQGVIVKEIPIGIDIKGMKVSSNGKWLAVGAADQYAYVFDREGKPQVKIPVSGGIIAVAVSDEGDLAVGTSDNKVLFYDRKGSMLGELKTKDVVTDVDLSHDGQYVAVMDYSGNAYVGDAKGRLLWSQKEQGAGQQIGMSANGKYLYTAYDQGAVYTYELESVLKSGKRAASIKQWIQIGLGVLAAGLSVFLVYWAWAKKPQILKRLWKDKYAYVMLLPSFSLIFVFMYYPSFSGLFHSLYDWNPGGRSEFVGLANFRRMIHDPYVTKGVTNLLILIVTGLIKTIIPPLLVAELIYYLKNKKSQYWFRTSFVVSTVIPGVGMLLVWQDLFDPNIGLINQLLHVIGLGSFAHSWLGDPNTALWALIFMGFPFIGILQLLVLYSGLIGISEEVIEAAKIDGAKTFRIIKSIHLPLLAGQFKLLIVLALIGIMQDFGSILIVTGGGPEDSTYVPALQMYFAATKFNDLGYASALGVSMFFVILLITIFNLKFMKSNAE